MNGSEAAKTTALPQARTGGMKAERPKLALVRKVEVDRSRDALLTDFGKTTLEDRYLLPGESYQDMFARVSTAFADDADHAQRVYDYMSRCGSCRRPRCSATAAPSAACRSAAS
jgi:ribonucleoside-diphosphate reductase alpha chain